MEEGLEYHRGLVYFKQLIAIVEINPDFRKALSIFPSIRDHIEKLKVEV